MGQTLPSPRQQGAQARSHPRSQGTSAAPHLPHRIHPCPTESRARGRRLGQQGLHGAAGWEEKAGPAPGHAPGGVALRHMLLNCFGSVLQKSSEVGRGEPGAALLEVGEAAWL